MQTRLLETNLGVGIPYPSVMRLDQDSNHGYVDLKQHPAKISDIPELWDCSELRASISLLNQPSSIFRTLGCAYTPTMPREASEAAAYSSYVHIAYEILHWNTSSRCYRHLYAEWERFLARERLLLKSVEVEFCIGPASFWEHGFDGWVASLRTYCSGSSPQEARRNWALALAGVTQFLCGQSQMYQPQLAGCLQTISEFPRTRSESSPNSSQLKQTNTCTNDEVLIH